MNIEIFDNVENFLKIYNEYKTKNSACFGLTPVECNFLIHIKESPLTMKDIAIKMNLSQSRATRIADSLEKKGIIERNLSKTDRRSFQISLTDKGSEIAYNDNNLCSKTVKLLDEKLTNSEKKSCNNSLKRLCAIFEESI